MSDHLALLFQNIGLSEAKAKETVKNKTLAPTLEPAIHSAGFDHHPSEKSTGALVYALASTITPGAMPHLDDLAMAVRDLKLMTGDQVAAAICFVEGKQEIDESEFNDACGVGVIVTRLDIVKAVNEYTKFVRGSLVKDRYKFFGLFFSGAKKFRASNGLTEKEVIVESTSTAEKIPDMFFEGELSKLHLPGSNPQLNASLMENHLARTGGKYVTRFPPEPNGFLHIGHAKAININFGLAKAHDGICYLRFDDTNPTTEKEEFEHSMIETVKWLGFTPTEITCSSTYFEKLYELAVELIKRDKAYVCHCTAEEIQRHRGGPERGPRTACAHRNRPTPESLALFQKMKTGGFEESEAILRMKMDLENGNPQFWDLVAYRIKSTPHHRTGHRWIIYPTYDNTHCLVDSFENITHSLCTSEFTQSRASYYWLCDALEVYKPVQWESGRLNVAGTVLSKRKIAELVRLGHVMALDDPRLFTLPAMRRRGVPAKAINNFIHTLGVTKADTVIEGARLDSFIRDYLNETAPRLMGVLDTIKVVIENLPEDYKLELAVPNKPKDASMGDRAVVFTREIWIDGSDFRETDDDKDFFRLRPGKTVGLLNVPCPITCTGFIVKESSSGKVIALKARYEDAKDFKRPKTYIQWVAESSKHGSPVRVDEVRIFDRLFHHANPLSSVEVPGGYLSDVNEQSLKVERNVFVETGIWELIDRWARTSESKTDYEEMRFQLTRIGYFCLDKDSHLVNMRERMFKERKDPEDETIRESVKKIVLNRTVSLPVSSSFKKTNYS